MFLVGEKNHSTLIISSIRLFEEEAEAVSLVESIRRQAEAKMEFIGRPDDSPLPLLRYWFIWRAQPDGSLKLADDMMRTLKIRDENFRPFGNGA